MSDAFEEDTKEHKLHLHIWPCSAFLTEAVSFSALPDLSRRRHVLLQWMMIFNHHQQETEIPTEIRILPTWPCPHWTNDDFQSWPTRGRNSHKPGRMGRWVLWGEDWTKVELEQRRFLCQPKEIAINSLENVLGPTDWDNVLTIDLRVWSAPPLPPFFVLSLSLLLLIVLITIVIIVVVPILLPSFLCISASSPSSVSLRPVFWNVCTFVLKNSRKQGTCVKKQETMFVFKQPCKNSFLAFFLLLRFLKDLKRFLKDFLKKVLAKDIESF